MGHRTPMTVALRLVESSNATFQSYWTRGSCRYLALQALRVQEHFAKHGTDYWRWNRRLRPSSPHSGGFTNDRGKIDGSAGPRLTDPGLLLRATLFDALTATGRPRANVRLRPQSDLLRFASRDRPLKASLNVCVTSYGVCVM